MNNHTIEPHPLEPIVLDLLAKSALVDVIDLTCAIKGTNMRGRCDKSYQRVARDVLEHMARRGVLEWTGIGTGHKLAGQPTTATANCA